MGYLKKIGLDHTRGQIFFSFILTMSLVLLLTVSSLYVLLSKVQRDNAALYIDEIALQTSGRLESQLNEVNVLTLQLAMDERIQEALSLEKQGHETVYDERMRLRKLLIEKTAYSDTIKDIELYSLTRSLYPIVEKSIEERVDERYLKQADDIHQAGAMIWIGRDPDNPDDLLAVRQLKLEKEQYASGGYLLIRLKPSIIDLGTTDKAKDKGRVMRLLDENNQSMNVGEDNGLLLSVGALEGESSDYVTVVRAIRSTGWKLQIMIPKKTLTADIYFLRDVLLWASVLSIFVFALLSYYLSKFITSPIRSLTRIIQGGKHGSPRENPDQYFNREVNQLNLTYNQMVKQINYLIKSVYETEIVKIKSEIKALHSQINPHFLFNTLDSLYWDHIRNGEQERAQIVIQLADLFRYTIHSSTQDGFVTIDEELEQVKRYGEIMKMRWRERLVIEIDCERELGGIKVPKLSIQPLVENAIVHGIEPMEHGGTIKLSVKEETGIISFTVKDNGIGIEPDQLHQIRERLQNDSSIAFVTGRNGIGLFNVCKLIQLHYGNQYGLTIDSAPGAGTTIVLKISLQPEPERGTTNDDAQHTGG
ncbi:sensor histidine kinase [Paenibacillus sinopodophylli]|uniref:sensor histidine kinase n=1 Tax=Paenibacillus sinopodophylli TaxID=1837342 RepID=UPI00110CED9E|nr:sensor histidine kinase [Paenibacillus sinopodophylli]